MCQLLLHNPSCCGYPTLDKSTRVDDIYDIREGDIMKAKPKYFEPRPPGTGNIGQHPVIILTKPDAYGRVKVATMSHSHPDNPPTRPASMYGLPIDPNKGESAVSVGKPKIIHIGHLKPHTPYATMTARHFAALKAEIGENYPDIYRVSYGP
ncbi:hypothetical protein BDZ97DRAFT_272509 [Flammula alnicola]|nr:hypothetical protein BDZ97DRAFT_272509 [Flammula alnicola]